MSSVLRSGALLCCVLLLPTALYAQASITGTVKDTSAAVLPGVTVEASSPELIEKVRSSITDATGQYRIENLRPGALEKLGLGWDVLHALNPNLTLVRISGYGQTGPYRDRPGFGAIGEAMGGIRYTTGNPDSPPARVGVSLGDSLASLHAAAEVRP